jgi:hypothetical protein
MRHLKNVMLSLGVAAFLAVSLASPAGAQGSGRIAAPPNSKPYGKSYAEWSAAWWQWAYGLPVDHHPLFDETGADAAVGQSGPVWYLGGVFNVSGSAHRTITVPKGTALFFPIINVEWDNICPPGSLTIDELRDLAGATADLATNLICEVDGVSVPNLSQYRVPAGPFSVTMPDGNIFQLFGCADVVAGTYGPLMGDGYYVMLQPLSKGNHTLHFSATFAPPISFTLDIVYDITVVDRNAAPATAALSPLSKSALSRTMQALRSASGAPSSIRSNVRLAPNPMRESGSGVLHFRLPQAGHVDARLFDTSGRLVRVLANRPFYAGEHDLRVDSPGRDLTPGIYYYRINAGTEKIEGKLVFVR